MMGDRQASIGLLDVRQKQKNKRKQMKMSKELERKENNRAELAEQFCVIPSETTAECPGAMESNSSDVESDTVPKRKHRRLFKTGTPAFVPHDILKDPDIQQHCERMGLTPTQTASLTRKIVEKSGGDADKISCSYSTADRSRTKAYEMNVNTIKDDWNIPQFATVHWDGKIMPSLESKYKSVDRFPVVISRDGNFKLLGIPIVSTATGSVIGEKVYDLVQQWKCTSNVVAMACDTTSTNTGHLSAACITFQQKLGRHLLWAMCRHHVGELIISNIYKNLIESSKAPEVKLFVRLQEVFDEISKTEFSYYLSHPDDLPPVLKELRLSMLQTAKQGQGSYPRDDYKEFFDLVRMYLCDDSLLNFKFLACGAVHNARWMSKCIYLLKVSLLSSTITALPAGTVLDKRGKQLPLIERFVQFICCVYAKWWFRCSLATEAPVIDLQLLRDLEVYKQIVLMKQLPTSPSKLSRTTFGT